MLAMTAAVLWLASIVPEAVPGFKAEPVKVRGYWRLLSNPPMSPVWKPVDESREYSLYFRNSREVSSSLDRNQPAAPLDYLEDYPNCGIRNNDTFDFLAYKGEDRIFGTYGTQCLWSCRWKDNPFLGKVYVFKDTQNASLSLNFISSVPRLPVDLRCMDKCTEVLGTALTYSSEEYFQRGVEVFFNCLRNNGGSDLFCMLLARRYNPFVQDSDFFLKSSTGSYFDIALDTCAMAILEEKLYNTTCDLLRINLLSVIPNKDNLTYTIASSLQQRRGRLLGPGVAPVVTTDEVIPRKNRNPWQCSLRSFGYEGVHRCGVTLLSGPPKKTIFVSAAHCNYLCKDSKERVVPICCCRAITDISSCRASDFCRKNSTLKLAEPKDLEIVCNLRTAEVTPQGTDWPPRITYLEILEIRNHPNYKPEAKGFDGARTGGPNDGYDISVYIVDDSNLVGRMNTTQIWPACLPLEDKDYVEGNQAILAGWIDPQPTFYLSTKITLGNYASNYLLQREALLEGQIACADPAWMGSKTYYPPGTVCYTLAGWSGTVTLGVSGSGLVRPFTASVGEGGLKSTKTTRYSWVGPLSLSKGSEHTVQTSYGKLYYLTDYNSNPAVFTDGRCFLDWIAAQFGLAMPMGYTKPASCDQSSGSQADVNNVNCLTRPFNSDDMLNQTLLPCDFTIQDKCKLFSFTERSFDQSARPQYVSNTYICKTSAGGQRVCANDCPGVNPNALVVGGEAVIDVAAVSGLGRADQLPSVLRQPLVGGREGLTSRGNGCQVGHCRTTRGECCPRVVISNRQVCPIFC